ncbi:MAG: diacylglycerol kinase [Pseudomonadota bacterium]
MSALSEESPHKSKSGLVRVWRAFLYSMAGLRAAYRHESAFRQELALAVMLTVAIIALPFTLTQRAILLVTVVIVLIAELLNSAIEAVVDRISLEDHQLAKRAKDLGSAAVFVSLMLCLIVWILVLLERFLW